MFSRICLQLEGGAWPSPTWKKEVWSGAAVGVVYPYLGVRGRGLLGAPRLWACARWSQGSRRRSPWRETLFEAGE